MTHEFDHTTDPKDRAALRVAWPFFFSTGPFWRNLRRNWPRVHEDVTKGDMLSIFGAELKASNDTMIKHCKGNTQTTGL